MAKAKYGYGWLLKFVLAALLLGVGIYMAIDREVVFVITGIAILIFSLLRVVPLVKSLNKEILRTINIVEILLDTILGVLMLYIAFAKSDELDQQPWAAIYRYSLVFVFYVRGLVYFNSVVFLGEKTEIPKFWFHILSLTIAVAIAVYKDFDANTVGLILLIIAFIGAAYLGYDGFNGYRKYREFQLELNGGKTKKKDKRIEKDHDVPDNVPEKQPVPNEEPDDKRPYVN